MIDTLIYDGTPLSDFFTFYDGAQLFDTPTKNVEYFSIPGKNGDLSISNNRYENVDINVPCYIHEDFVENYNALMNFLYSRNGYCRLETHKESDMYRMAEFTESVTPNTTQHLYSGLFTLIFNCKPQKWLKEGEHEIDATNDLTLFNPTQMIAKPFIIAKGIGSVTINNRTLTLNTNTGTTIIDCEIEDAYQGTINRNGDLIVTSEFPILETGANEIRQNGFDDLKIIPNWWTI